MYSTKRIFLALMLILMSSSAMLFAQSTEGKDFWVTLMRACDDAPDELSLRISAKTDAQVTIENTYTGYTRTVNVPANGIESVVLSKTDCYVGTSDNKKVTNKALHVSSDVEISLIAANYREQSFDVAAILPTDALLDEYIVCTYPATDHDSKPQGSHFAIVATEDNTIVDYMVTTMPDTIAKLQTKFDGGYPMSAAEQAMLDGYYANPTPIQETTPVLQKGQVFYFWTGLNNGDASDLTGTHVQARDGKKIAVFNGNPHTNIPNAIRDRDHIYSQAMPVAYWGTQFALTSSLTTIKNISDTVERIDKVRIEALEDGTTVTVNGQLLHTFDFSVDKKHYFEFEFGANTQASSPYPAGITRLNTTNCFVSTSCPCGVHLFMVSNRYDYPNKKYNGVSDADYCNGDPSMIWINPIEQQIEEITFGTFETTKVKDHFLNIVTSAANTNITLDGTDITSEFTPMVGNSNYVFTRKKIVNGTHTLKADHGVIAHVYGFGNKESYGYPAGAKTVPLEQFITINGEIFSSESQNTLCGKDTIHFALDLNYDVTSVTWNFGDGSPIVKDVQQVDHYYQHTGNYEAYVLIDRESANLCHGQLAHDSIPIRVLIGKLELAITDTVNDICKNRKLELYFSNTGTSLNNGNCTFTFNDKAKANGFTTSSLSLAKDHFLLTIPVGAKEGEGYSFTADINTGCGDTTLTVGFAVPFDPTKLIAQRFDNVLVATSEVETDGVVTRFVSYKWFKDGEEMPGETEPVLNLHNEIDTISEYMVQLTSESGNVIETCPIRFATKHAEDEGFAIGFPSISTATTVEAGGAIYVVTTAEGTADLYNVGGQLLSTTQLSNVGGYVDMPQEKGIYILRVQSANEKAHFKVYVL